MTHVHISSNNLMGYQLDAIKKNLGWIYPEAHGGACQQGY
jgi:hypothetical protein